MSDAEQNLDVNEEVKEVKTEDTQDYKALYEKTLQDLEKVAAHKEQLYKETKAAKAAKEQAALEAQKLVEETAKKNGEFEKLWKTASQEKEELLQQLKALKHGSRQEKLNAASMKIAAELADGHNAELLSEFVKRNLENLADDDGSLSDDIVKAVASEFKGNEKFKSLLRGSKAAGGGAPGNMRGAQAVVEKSQKEFDILAPNLKHEFLDKGGKIIN